MIRIAVDIYGGDNAPQASVDGVIEALEMMKDVQLVLFGAQQEIEQLLSTKEYDHTRISIVDAPDQITNHDHPTMAVRRKANSSMVRCFAALKNGEVDAMVSAGSTGAQLAGGIFKVGRIKGIDRPALAPLIPTASGAPVMLIDSGANADCKPEYLVQFALMGQVYMHDVMGVENPKVGLLNIGAEAEKGSELTKTVYPLLQKAEGINFYGNIEAREALTGEVQVIVCDGFAGNVFLKSTEGTAMLMMGMLKEGFMSSMKTKIGALLAKPALRKVKNSLDSEQYGGAALLGVDGVMVKAHGSSKAHGFACAIRQAYTMVKGNVINIIKQQLAASDVENKED